MAPALAFLTTALFNQAALAEPTAFAELRYVVVGGEALAPDRIRRVVRAGKPGHLLNVYGPTESTTFVTSFEIHDLAEDATTTPIGRPIARTTCYVLDQHGEPAPIGVPGELHPGGDGLAVGYIGGPPELAARFVPDRFSATPGARLYRTGDRARWRADGTIELLGRLDRQIKLRGFRVEPGEVEAVLQEHLGVAEAAVMLHQRERLGPRLVAFVIPAPGADPAPAGLRPFARERLPDYMTPAELVTLPRLPLTASGKIDRATLAAIEVAVPAGEPPRTPLERAVAAILAELLGTEKVGLDDDFFALGGHSLLAVRATAAVSARFDVPFKLRHFFLAPTTRAIATAVLALRLARLSSAEQQQILREASARQPGEVE